MKHGKFEEGKEVLLKGCTQRMTLVSIDQEAETGLCKWTDSTVPKIHQEVFNLSDLKTTGLNINFSEVEKAFSDQAKFNRYR
ncbi:TPA: hypothetical protein ACNIDW_001652 [Acinetobacter nosocomialis]